MKRPSILKVPQGQMVLKNVRLLMFALAIFFFGWALRNVFSTEITFNDQARHAMNGVALLDMVRDGEIQHPASYLRRYFARLPALSMPYHPPLFPAVEAIFYAVFGVNPFAPRLAVALCVFGSVLFLFGIVHRIHGSATLAASVVVVFFSLPLSQQLAADVMLEMPALLPALAAFWYMISLKDSSWEQRDAVLAGTFAAVAVWTKQVLFIGLIPLFLIAVGRRWKLLYSRSVWLFLLIYGGSVLALAALWAKAGLAGSSKGWAPTGMLNRLAQNSLFYASTVPRPLSMILLVVVAGLCALLFVTELRPVLGKALRLYVCWILACALVLLAVPAFDVRYFWFLYPALLAILFSTSQIVAERFLRPSHVRWAILVAAAGLCLANLRHPAPRLTGPRSAAQYVLKAGAERVLYCGGANGSFIFAVRSIDPSRAMAVLRADKIASTLRDESVDGFTARYGIRFVVVERNRVSNCEDFLARSGSLGAPEQVIPLSSSERAFEGSIQILRQTKAFSNSPTVIEMPFTSTGESFALETGRKP